MPALDSAGAIFDVAQALVTGSPDAALAWIGPAFAADRAWLIRFDPPITAFWVAYEWCAEGVPACLPDFPGVPVGLIAQPLRAFRRGEAAVYADIEKLPPDAQALKEEMRREGNRATAAYPLFHDRRLVALIGLDDVRRVHRWSAAEMALLGRLGELVLAAADRISPVSSDIAAGRHAPAPNGCYVRAGNCHVQVGWDEIESIEASGDYSRVRLRNGREFLELKALAVWEAMLPRERFGRVHRSWIVGWRNVERVSKGSGGRWALHLRHRPVPLPIGRRFQPAVREHINLRAS